MRRLYQLTLLLLLPFYLHQAQAIITGEMIMIRSPQSFPETMSSLQESIKQQGYTVSRVQRVDIGLTSSGYKTDKYRIVFFGKQEELHHLMSKHPTLIPYLPLKIAIFAEGEETILVCTNPKALADLYPDPALTETFGRWKKDVANILKRVQFSD